MGMHQDWLGGKHKVVIDLMMAGMNNGEIAKLLEKYNSIRPRATFGKKLPKNIPLIL